MGADIHLKSNLKFIKINNSDGENVLFLTGESAVGSGTPERGQLKLTGVKRTIINRARFGAGENTLRVGTTGLISRQMNMG